MSDTAMAAGVSGTPLLALRGYSKSFGPVEAMKDVSLEVHPGEVVGLVGDNGAGKSTLIKAIAGAQPADEGTTEFEGRQVQLSSPHASTDLGIATVYQDLALCENLDVVANLYLGQEATRKPGRIRRAMTAVAERIRALIDRIPVLNRLPHLPRGWWPLSLVRETDMEKKAEELLGSLGVTTLRSVRTDVENLSGGQRQAIAIARSMLGEPKLVMLDEPTAALGVVQTQQILELILRLKQRGLGVIVISHNLADVFKVADRVVVLRLGRIQGSYEIGKASQEQIVAAITGAEFGGGRDTEEAPL